MTTLRLIVVCLLLMSSIAQGSPLEPRDKPDVISAIRQLAPGHAVVLGQASVAGPLNATALRYGLDLTGPRARNYTRKMVWAADRQRALFLGANHAVPHRLNDVWEFDLAALAWVLLYAPDNSRSYKGLGEDASDVVFERGWLRTRRGGPAVIGHGWWGVTYDPVGRALLFMNPWVTDQNAAILQLGGDPQQRYRGPPLWKFSPDRGGWAPQESSPPHPSTPMGALLEYVPELRGAIWHMNAWNMRSTWIYEPERQAWRDLEANRASGDFREQAPARELVGYHDPVRRLIVVQQGRQTFHFDIALLSWRRVVASRDTPGDSVTVPQGHGARTSFHYDSATGQGLLVDFQHRTIWAYNPDKRAWSRIEPRGDAMPKGERALAYFDHAHAVLVVVDDRLTWAYRHAPSA